MSDDYAPNQQNVRGDGSGPAEEGDGGSEPVEGTGGTPGTRDAPEVSGSYDPGENTVEDVRAYVEEHPDEAEQVLTAERSGKDRTTLTTWLEEHLG